MNKFFCIFLSIALIFSVSLISGCSTNDPSSDSFSTPTLPTTDTSTTNTSKSNDLYVGEYVCVDELDGTMTITKNSTTGYKIILDFTDLTIITAEGNVKNGTLYYEGIDKFGNTIYGTIEEYGEDYPVRVELYGDGLSDEIEFERE